MTILEKLQKTCNIKEAAVLADSELYSAKDECPTEVAMINVALSGRVDGGLTSGLTVLAGPSKHFKTCFGLLMAAAYLKKHKDGVLVFYDSEFGSPPGYFQSFGIDTSRVLHIPIKNIEELRFDVVNQLEEIGRKDHVMVMMDSVGNLASKKEVDDAKSGNSAADMTRAKQLKSLFRMVTPFLTLKNIPMVVINHTYQEIGLFPKQIVSGGTGVTYSADNIWIIGRRQEKVGTEIAGYHFVINVEKSRFVKEKSKIPITVTWEGGVQRWSGLLDVALEGGYVIKPKNGWYAAFDPETKTELSKNVRAKTTLTEEFWKPVFAKTDFIDYITRKFKMTDGPILQEVEADETESEEDEITES